MSSDEKVEPDVKDSSLVHKDLSSGTNLSQNINNDVTINRPSFCLDSLPKITRKNKMSIEHAKRTMQFLDQLFGNRYRRYSKGDKEKKRLTSTESRRQNGEAKERKIDVEQNKNNIATTHTNSGRNEHRKNVEKDKSKHIESEMHKKKTTSGKRIKKDTKKVKTIESENVEISLTNQESQEEEMKLYENDLINDNIMQHFKNTSKKQIKPMKPEIKEDETLQDRKEKNEFLKFLQFLGVEHKKKKEKKDIAKIENAECSIPISDFEQLFAKKDDKEQLAWKQLKTVKYERDIIYFGSRTNISWQVEKDIKFQDELGKKNDDSNKVNFIPQKELIENDIKNKTLQKFTSEIEEKDKLYSQTPKWNGKINDKNGKLPDQRIFKNQKQNWLLDIDPWLAEEEPWKTMEAEEKCFSLKLIPDNILNISEHSKAEKKDTVQKCEEEIVNKVGKKKLMLQKYLTTQEENMFEELKKEAEKNYHELNKNLLLSGRLNDFERKCCKVYKKNHKCKRLPTKQKQDDDKSTKILSDDAKNEDMTNIRPDYNLELYSRLLEESNKLISQKYTEAEKPLHPLFGNKAVLAKQFLRKEKIQFSLCHQDTMKVIYKKIAKSQHKQHSKLNKREKEIKRTLKPCPITIYPIQKLTIEKDSKENLSSNQEKLSELQWIVKEGKSDKGTEAEDEHILKFANLKKFNIVNRLF